MTPACNGKFHVSLLTLAWDGLHRALVCDHETVPEPSPGRRGCRGGRAAGSRGRVGMDNMARCARELGRTAGSLGRVGMDNMAALALQGVAIVV